MTFQADVPQQADLAARLAPIRAHFVATLAPRRERLTAYLRSGNFRTPDPAVMRVLQEDAHKMRGVAPTLGFDRLGKAAGEVDEMLNPWKEALEVLEVPPELHLALESLLDEIEATIANGP